MGPGEENSLYGAIWKVDALVYDCVTILCGDDHFVACHVLVHVHELFAVEIGACHFSGKFRLVKCLVFKLDIC